MERLYNYIEHVVSEELETKGFLYLSDDVLFVKEKISKRIIDLDLTDILSNKRTERIDKFNSMFFEMFENHRKSLIKPLIEYQQFLDENRFTKNQRSKLKKLFYNRFDSFYSNIKQVRNDYFYIPTKVELRFIDSIENIIIQIKPFKENNNVNLFFRGHSNLLWKLIPSIYRGDFVKNEHKMFREILIRNPEEFISTKSAFEKLTIMQHYGLPTRLLDITKNPLVAMYFACSDNSQKNNSGEILFFTPDDEIVKYYDSDTVSILSNIAKADRDLSINPKLAVEDFNDESNGKIVNFLHLVKEEKPYFLPKIDPKDFNRVLIVKPINNNLRIKRQQGYFFIFGIDNTISRPATADFTYKEDAKQIKFIIESNKKEEIIKELEVVGISKDTLFPEIDNGTEYIKSKY